MPELSQTTDACESYRSQWQHDAGGPAGIAQYFGGVSKVADVDQHALAELIQVDIELAWSHWSTNAEELVRHSITPDDLLELWKQLPWFQLYAVLFRNPDDMMPYWARLANAEANCRDRFGDAIGSQYYQHNFEVETVNLVRRPRRLLRCDFERNEEYSQVLYPLRGRSEIGRQRSRDKEPYFCENLPNGNRIVVASRNESEVSREQLTLQLMTPTVAIITNQSQVNSIRLSPDNVLRPGAKACAIFPFTVQIPGRRLSCY